jgi:signal transduction histidine kinase
MNESSNQPTSAPDQARLAEGSEERKFIESTSFSVNARVAMQLGRESISSAVTAILELVKNAYDADAELVRIRFHGLATENQMMVVEDNGRGMTMDDLRNNWMVLGTANKSKIKKSGKDRVMIGEKGLGRLGLDRLCERTQVQSITEKAAEALELDINWKKYEGANLRLEEIKHDLYGRPSLRQDPITRQWREFPSGTRLILTGLKDEWSEELIAELRAELSLLVSPFAKPNDFRIELDSGMGWKSVDGFVTTPEFLLDSAQWKVVATISDEGVVEVEMSSRHHNKKYHEGPTPWSDSLKGVGSVPHCGPLRFEFYFFPRKSTEFGNQIVSKSTIQNFLDQNQGVRIYRDNFRVKPYGKPNGEGDWLRLAFRRITSPEGVAQDEEPGAWRVGYNQVIGAVFISREKNAELQDQTNREGLADNKAFAHMRAFADKVVRFFEINNQDFVMSQQRRKSAREEAGQKAEESVQATEQAMKTFADLAQQITTLMRQSASGEKTEVAQTVEETTAKKLTEIQTTLDAARNQLVESAKMFRKEEERESQEKNTLANLASLGILAASFGHETLGWANTIVINAGWLERNVPNYFFFAKSDDEQKVRQKLADTREQAHKIETFAEFSIDNIKPYKRKKTFFCLKKVIINVFKVFDDSLRVQRNIKLDVVDNLPPHACRIRGYPIDWESIFANLITNAVWAMKNTPAEMRRIRVALRQIDSNYVLTFDDNGIGLEAGSEERIFLPTYSTKRNEKGETIGTGMGLAIVKTFVEQNTGGSIQARTKGELDGAGFVITVPAAQGENTEASI